MTRPHRVTFGPGTFLLGASITVVIFGLPLGPPGYVFSIAAALLLGMPLALLTGVLMRPSATSGATFLPLAQPAVVRLVPVHDKAGQSNEAKPAGNPLAP